MKRIILAVVLSLPLCASAIPIVDGPKIVGYEDVEKTYNGWGGGPLHIFGHKHKHYHIPIYQSIETVPSSPVSNVPEPSIYAMMLVALVFVASRVNRSQ